MPDLEQLLNDKFEIHATYQGGVVILDCGVYAVRKFPDEQKPIAITVYSQNDPRWANEIYSYSMTFAATGCLVCCVAMIISIVYPEEIQPPEVAQNLKREGAFIGDMLSRPSRIPSAYNRLSWGGVVHWRTKAADIDLLKRELNTYGCAIAEVKWNPSGASPEKGNQHFVVVTSLTDNGDAIICDPWDGKIKLLSESRYRLENWSTARTLHGLRLVRPEM